MRRSIMMTMFDDQARLNELTATFDDQVGLKELMACQDKFSAAQQALIEFQRRLGTIEGWRASTAWECIERALDELLGDTMWDAFNLPSKPSDFMHWREKYSPPDGDHVL